MDPPPLLQPLPPLHTAIKCCRKRFSLPFWGVRPFAFKTARLWQMLEWVVLLPVSLPLSDGKIIHVLTNPAVTTSRVLADNWAPQSLLREIASAQPPPHALIDTGAFITNMDNEEVGSARHC